MSKGKFNFNKTAKLLLFIAAVFTMTKVNVVSQNEKISNENLNKTLDLTAMAFKLNEIQLADKYYALDTYTGDVTGYVANCPLCTGYLACTSQYVGDGTITYNDSEYGEVMIVASSSNLPCGSIVTFDAGFYTDKKIVAIVLDRGVLGTDLDLLVSSEAIARQNVGRHNLSYDVLRFGWSR